jgi:hypothetical protein
LSKFISLSRSLPFKGRDRVGMGGQDGNLSLKVLKRGKWISPSLTLPLRERES